MTYGDDSLQWDVGIQFVTVINLVGDMHIHCQETSLDNSLVWNVKVHKRQVEPKRLIYY